MSDKPKPPASPDALELVIQERRDHLATTIDELTARVKPKEIGRRSALGVVARIRTLTHGDDGQVRAERLAAAGGAVVLLVGVLLLARRRK